MTTSEAPMNYAELMQWVRQHRAQINEEAKANNELAVAVFASDVVHTQLNNVRTEAALRKAVAEYIEGKQE